MSDYRDYGTIGDAGHPGVSTDTIRYGQVYQATHSGSSRLSYMNRSFISFSFGTKKNDSGKEVRVYIEDFNLLATITSNRLSRNGYADFKDNVSSYDNLEGQFYWNTHYSTNSITFNLSTDGMDQRQLDDFLYWFKAGVARELILSEHPNRAIMARVSKPPALSLLPFEGEAEISIGLDTYKTKTTLYKGEITLELVADDPHWYAITNVLGKKDEINHRYLNIWEDQNGQEISIFASQDALKILYEDGIPLGSMIQNNMLLGNGAYAKVEDNATSKIWSLAEEDIVWDGTAWEEGSTPSGQGARIEANDAEPPYLKGVIAGAIIDINGNGIVQLNSYQKGYFYYAGTAPAPTEISFTIQPYFDGAGLFSAISDDINNSSKPYNSIFIKSIEQQELRFTTPNLIHSYNKAVKILIDELLIGPFTSVVDIRERITKEVKHPGVRAWVMAFLSDEESVQNINTENIAANMVTFFKQDDGSYAPITFKFNSKTGEATAHFTYRAPTEELSLTNLTYAENAMNKINTISSPDQALTNAQRYENIVTWGWDLYCIDTSQASGDEESDLEPYYPDDPTDNDQCGTAVQYFLNYVTYCIDNKISIPTVVTVNESSINISNLVETTENVGDMLLSNNIVIKDRNQPNGSGYIVANTAAHPEYSHSIEHNLMSPIYNIQVLYRNMYL